MVPDWSRSLASTSGPSTYPHPSLRRARQRYCSSGRKVRDRPDGPQTHRTRIAPPPGPRLPTWPLTACPQPAHRVRGGRRPWPGFEPPPWPPHHRRRLHHPGRSRLGPPVHDAQPRVELDWCRARCPAAERRCVGMTAGKLRRSWPGSRAGPTTDGSYATPAMPCEPWPIPQRPRRCASFWLEPYPRRT